MNTYQSFFAWSIFALFYISSGIGAYMAIKSTFGKVAKPIEWYMSLGFFMFIAVNLWLLVIGCMRLYQYLGTLS